MSSALAMKPADWMPDPLYPPAPPVAFDPTRVLPSQGRLPAPVLAAIGERLAAEAVALQRDGADRAAGLAALESWGLQLQELAQVVAHAPQLRREAVDLGMALLQSLAEWSSEAGRRGAELHGPACTVLVQLNPAALKHLLDLLIEHALQQGRTVRLDVVTEAGNARLTVHVDAAPASACPERETLAWQLLLWLARSLSLAPERHAVTGGEVVSLVLPAVEG